MKDLGHKLFRSEMGAKENVDTIKGCNREVAPLKQRFSTRCNRMAVSDAVCVI